MSESTRLRTSEIRRIKSNVLLVRSALTDVGRTMFYEMTPPVRKKMLARLTRLAAKTETEITRARDPKQLKLAMFKVMMATAMITAAKALRRARDRRWCAGRAAPNPNSSTSTPFTIFTGSSNIYVSLDTTALPITGYQFTLNSQSSAGAKVTLVTLQSGVG
jgi:hypothetical protein